MRYDVEDRAYIVYIEGNLRVGVDSSPQFLSEEGDPMLVKLLKYLHSDTVMIDRDVNTCTATQ